MLGSWVQIVALKVPLMRNDSYGICDNCKRKKKHRIDVFLEKKNYATAMNCEDICKMTIDPWFEWSG